MWGLSVAIITSLFEILYKKKKFHSFEKLMSVSSLYYCFGGHFQREHKSPCHCKCKEMKQFKIKDSFNKWVCEHIDSTLGLKAWCWDDYYRRLSRKICQKCFKNHWHGVKYRKLDLLCDL